MNVRKSGRGPAKSSHLIIRESGFSIKSSLLKSSLYLLFSAVILLFQSNPVLSNEKEIYLFMNPDDNAESDEVSNTIENLLGSMLEDELEGWAVMPVSKDQMTFPTVGEYVRKFNIPWYLKVKVCLSKNGLYLDIVLVAKHETFDTFVNIGAGKGKDSETIRLRLRKIPLFYRAMLNGINPRNIIYVKCFKPMDGVSHYVLERKLTLQLPSRLEEIIMCNQYCTTGVGHLDFEKYCEGKYGGLTEEDLRYLRIFRHVIEGYISKTDGEVEIPVHVYSGNRMHTITSPPLKIESVIDDLANYIADCWGKWDERNCQ